MEGTVLFLFQSWGYIWHNIDRRKVLERPWDFNRSFAEQHTEHITAVTLAFSCCLLWSSGVFLWERWGLTYLETYININLKVQSKWCNIKDSKCYLLLVWRYQLVYKETCIYQFFTNFLLHVHYVYFCIL